MGKKFIILFLLFSLSQAFSSEVKVLAFAGSTRKASVNKKLVIEAANCARQMKARVTVIDLKEYPIPLYDGDLDAEEGIPSHARKIRQLMMESDVIFIASPEYNGSLSAVLKNLLDWVSKSEESTLAPFKGKVFAIMSASPGASGGAHGLIHLREILKRMGGTVLPHQVVVAQAYRAFTKEGQLKDIKVKEELEYFVQEAIQRFG